MADGRRAAILRGIEVGLPTRAEVLREHMSQSCEWQSVIVGRDDLQITCRRHRVVVLPSRADLTPEEREYAERHAEQTVAAIRGVYWPAHRG